MQLSDIKICVDESVILTEPTICFGNVEQQQTYHELLLQFPKNFTSTTV
jgi:hypothetical protein